MPKQTKTWIRFGWAVNIALLVAWSLWMQRMGWDKHKEGKKRPQVFFGLGGSGDKEKEETF